MRKLLVSILIFMTAFNAGPAREREARAVAPVALAIPEVAVGALVILATACALAASAGINRETNERYARELNDAAQSLQAKIKRGVQVTAEMMAPIVALILTTNTSLGGRIICGSIMAKLSVGGVSQAKTNEARATSEGECQPELRGDPYKCCPNFMKKFGSSRLTKVGSNAFRIFFYGRHAATHSCCFEWDSLHGRFEVYQQGNHSATPVHRGEKACAREEDLDEESLCSATFTDKADLLSNRHAPRNGCP